MLLPKALTEELTVPEDEDPATRCRLARRTFAPDKWACRDDRDQNAVGMMAKT
jgi:hypothetical protein